MSILEGGIFSNPRGKTGGLVFGAARTRTGKKVTARLLVPPSNPNTAAQQIQRSKFAEALAIVRLIGATFYQSDWNRSIGQLPGFQSLTSIYLNSMDDIADIGVIPSINLGSLFPGSGFTLNAGAPSSCVYSWNTQTGLNGTDDDIAVVIAISTSKATSPLERVVDVDTSLTRISGGGPGPAVFPAGTDVTGLMYFRGVGTAEGLLSATQYDSNLCG